MSSEIDISAEVTALCDKLLIDRNSTLEILIYPRKVRAKVVKRGTDGVIRAVAGDIPTEAISREATTGIPVEQPDLPVKVMNFSVST